MECFTMDEVRELAEAFRCISIRKSRNPFVRFWDWIVSNIKYMRLKKFLGD